MDDDKAAELPPEVTLRAITGSALDGIVLADAKGIVVFWNEGARRLFGYEASEALGSPVTHLMPERYRAPHLAGLERLAAGGEARVLGRTVELAGLKKDGAEFPLELSLSSSAQGGQPIYTAILRDISKRNEAENQLQVSEDRFRQMAASIKTVFWLSNPEISEIYYVSPAYEEVWGQSCQSLYEDPKSFLAPVHPEDRERVFAALEGHEAGHWDVEYRIVRPDGSVRWVHDQGYGIRNEHGALYRMAGTAEDVTKRRLVEEELRESRERFRMLTAKLLVVREEERRTVAREIHDQLGQALTGLKLDLSWLESLTDQHDLLERIKAMIGQADGALVTVRELASRLRPPVLDDLGLEAAIESYAEKFAKRTGCSCKLDLKAEGLDFNLERDTAVYRILQEALTNVTRHADASRVHVSLHTAGEELLLEVRDDGRGIEEAERAGSGSLGLLGMRERAAAMRGELEVRRGESGGTVVALTIPKLV